MKNKLIIFLTLTFLIPFSVKADTFNYTWNNYFTGRHDVSPDLDRTKICGINTYNETDNIIDIFTSKDYLDPVIEDKKTLNFIEQGRKTYESNMSNIYKCAMISTQRDVIKNRILDNNESILNNTRTVRIRNSIKETLERIDSELEEEFQEIGCRDHINHRFDRISVLNRVTKETCEYNFYMEYLKEYYSHPPHIMQILDNQRERDHRDDVPYVSNISIFDINRYAESKIIEANNNIELAYRVFPFAYELYLDFENNFPLHVLLTAIRESFITFRTILYETTRPIDQVIYKIHNAMKAP